MQNERIRWVDWWKGFMLMAVCLDHFHISWKILDFIIPVHVASFFFISGLIFNPMKYKTFKLFLLRKTNTLILPYLYLSFLFLFITPKLYDPSLKMLENHRILELYFNTNGMNLSDTWDYFLFCLGSIFIEGNSTISTSPLWFVYVLYAVEIIMYKICQRKKITIFIFAILLFFGGWMCNIKNLFLPFKAEVVLSASFIFIFGFMSKNIIKKLGEYSNRHIIVISIILFLSYWFSININGCPHLFSNTLCHNWAGYIMTIVSGIYLFACIFLFISRFFQKVTSLEFIAQNGIIILAAHYYVDRIARFLFPQYVENVFFPYFLILTAFIFCGISIWIVNNYFPFLVGKTAITKPNQ